MRRVGDLLTVVLDDRIIQKAQEHSRLFSAWKQLAAKHGISAAADHSAIQDIKTGILLIEAEHPGWIQILQTKEQALLAELKKSFPELGITGIAFRLSKKTGGNDTRGFEETEPEVAALDAVPEEESIPIETSGGADSIANEELRGVLESLGQSIAGRTMIDTK